MSERFDLGTDLLPVRIFEQDVDLKKPSMEAILEHENAIAKAKEDPKKIYNVMRSFIVKMGMPESLADRMTMDQYVRLTEYLRPAKKN